MEQTGKSNHQLMPRYRFVSHKEEEIGGLASTGILANIIFGVQVPKYEGILVRHGK